MSWLTYEFEDYLKEFNFLLEHCGNKEKFESFQSYKFDSKYYLGKRYIDYQRLLYESLMYSYPAHTLVKKLDKKFNEHIRYIGYGGEDLNLEDNIYLLIDSDSYTEEIKKICNVYGYFIAQQYYNENYKSFVYIIETTYGITDVSEKIYNNEKYLYHITTPNVWYKIQKYGLCPKYKEKFAVHPERVYCLTKCNEGTLNALGEELYPDKNYIILQIDISKIGKNKPKFFIDSAFEKYGVFTSEPITPYAISKLV